MTISCVHVTVVLAMSADGKIADRDRTAARFSSSQDLLHLEQIVAQQDAVLFGAGTLRAYGTCLPVRQPELLAQRQARQQPSQPIQIVCSRSGNLDPQLKYFQQAVPRWLLTSQSGALHWSVIARGTNAGFEQILPDLTEPVQWSACLQQLAQWGIHRLALLGGGSLVANFAEQNLIDEVYLTICPLLLGGQTAPTPFDGFGLPVADALPLRLMNVSHRQNEVFLHYRRCHSGED